MLFSKVRRFVGGNVYLYWWWPDSYRTGPLVGLCEHVMKPCVSIAFQGHICAMYEIMHIFCILCGVFIPYTYFICFLLCLFTDVNFCVL